MENTGFMVRISNFLKQPFNEQGDLWNWILFTILIVTVAVFWKMVLDTITEEL